MDIVFHHYIKNISFYQIVIRKVIGPLPVSEYQQRGNNYNNNGDRKIAYITLQTQKRQYQHCQVKKKVDIQLVLRLFFPSHSLDCFRKYPRIKAPYHDRVVSADRSQYVSGYYIGEKLSDQ